MYQGSLLRLSESIEAVKRQLSISEALRSLMAEGKLLCAAETPCFDTRRFVEGQPESAEWKIIDHCSAVTRIYALYEQFAHQLIRDYTAFLESYFLFRELQPAFRTYYRAGLGRIFERKDGPRYVDLSLDELVENYHLALSDSPSYRLEPAALLIHEQNLRLAELSRLFNSCGIENVQGWVAAHPEVETFFKDQDRTAAGPENELARLIQYRNDAAHGGQSVDDLAGLAILQEFADFIFLLCSVLAERVQLALLLKASEKQLATDHGQITEVFRKGSVIIAPVIGEFWVGQVVYLAGNGYCSRRVVQSIQLNDVSQTRIELDAQAELGLGLDGRGKEGATIFSMRQ